jgi:hypothetical protein
MQQPTSKILNELGILRSACTRGANQIFKLKDLWFMGVNPLDTEFAEEFKIWSRMRDE